MKARSVRPITLAAHRFNRQLRTAGAAVSLPDLHRSLDTALRAEITSGVRQIGIAVLLYFLAIQGARGALRFSLGFVDVEPPVLYVAFCAAALILGFAFSGVNCALIIAYRSVVTTRMVGRRSWFSDLAPVLSGTTSLGDIPFLGTTYLATSTRFRGGFAFVQLLFLLPMAMIFFVLCAGLTDLMAGALFGAGQTLLDRMIACSGLLLIGCAFGIMILPGVPVRLSEDRGKLRNLLLLGISLRERRVHPRYRAWYGPPGGDPGIDGDRP